LLSEVFDASKQRNRFGVDAMQCDMNVRRASLSWLIAVDVSYLGPLLLLQRGFPILPVLMLQGSVQDRDNGDGDRYDEEWNQQVEDSHQIRAIAPVTSFSNWCALTDNLSTEPGAMVVVT
jgi:hypothetical protein